MSESGMTDAVFAMRRVTSNRNAVHDIHAAFIDLETAYDRAPREEVWKCMRVKGVSEKYVKLVKEMYEGADK